MQDRICRIDENLLQRTAGPYIWVNRVVLAVVEPLPVYPDNQTISEPVRTSRSGHFRTHAVQQNSIQSSRRRERAALVTKPLHLGAAECSHAPLASDA
jgi:hypothetical protein